MAGIYSTTILLSDGLHTLDCNCQWLTTRSAVQSLSDSKGSQTGLKPSLEPSQSQHTPAKMCPECRQCTSCSATVLLFLRNVKTWPALVATPWHVKAVSGAVKRVQDMVNACMHYSVADAHPCSEVENASSELSQLMPTLTDTLE